MLRQKNGTRQLLEIWRTPTGRDTIKAIFKDHEFSQILAKIDRHIAQIEQGEIKASFDLYGATTNLFSFLQENLLQEFASPAVIRTLMKEINLFMPSYPPNSPITNSFYSYHSIFDNHLPSYYETFARIVGDFFRETGQFTQILPVADVLHRSSMALYRCLDGGELDRGRLFDMVAKREIDVDFNSGFTPVKEGLLITRLLPYLGPGLLPTEDPQRALSSTTPYLLASPSAASWERFLEKNFSKKGALQMDLVKEFFKRGRRRNEWVETFFDGYFGYTSSSVTIMGLPGIPLSQPLSEATRDLEYEMDEPLVCQSCKAPLTPFLNLIDWVDPPAKECIACRNKAVWQRLKKKEPPFPGLLPHEVLYDHKGKPVIFRIFFFQETDRLYCWAREVKVPGGRSPRVAFVENSETKPNLWRLYQDLVSTLPGLLSPAVSDSSSSALPLSPPKRRRRR